MKHTFAHCVECGKGFRLSSVRRIYGMPNTKFCSPQCLTRDAMRREKAKEKETLDG